MPPEKKLERQQIQLLIEAISGLPRVAETSTAWNPRGHETWSDAEIKFKTKDGARIALLVEAKSRSLFPRDIRDILWSQRNEKRFLVPEAPVAMLVAYSLSQGAKEILKENEVGYFDSGGSLFIPGNGFYVLIDKPEPKPIEKKNRSMFKGKRAQVMHALLQRHGQWVSVKDIAEAAKVSPAMTSETMSMLDLYDWISSRGNGPSKERCLHKPGLLLDAWVKQLESVKPPTYRGFYVPRKKPESIAKEIATQAGLLKTSYALTGEYAAQLYMPYLTAISTLRCKVRPGRAEEFTQLIGAKAVNEGANLMMLESRDEGDFLFPKKIDGLNLASPLMVYLDLIRSPGRGPEMADHLRREVLSY